VKYQVVVTSAALLELSEAAIWWAENRSLEQAAKWHEGISAALDGLRDNPEQHGYARENHAFSYTLRQLSYGLGRKPTHRAIFHISDLTVTVISVRHVAQENLRPPNRE
jgi:plasmid stabilization system protein ParE